MPGIRVTPAKTTTVRREEMPLTGRHTRIAIRDRTRRLQRSRLTANREFDRLFGGHCPGMKEVQIGDLAGKLFGLGQARAGVFSGEPCNIERGTHRVLDRLTREVGCVGVAAALAQVNRHRKTLVPVLFDGLHLAPSHVDRQAVALGEPNGSVGSA